jgi:hypothetical protein
VLDTGVTVLVAAVIFWISTRDFSKSTKVALDIALIAFEMNFLFGRFVLRKLKALEERAVDVLPRNKLTRIIGCHLEHQRRALLDRVQALVDHQACVLEKHEMYAELIGLTAATTELRSGAFDASIVAISSINILDFNDEPLAEAYLEANEAAVADHITVQRLFLLTDNEAASHEYAREVQKHAQILVSTDHPESGVKWLLTKHARSEDRDLDIAILIRKSLCDNYLEVSGS